MTVSERIVLREDVAGPAAKAAAKVEQLAGALGQLGKVDVDAGAAGRIERAAKAASKANERATEAANRAAAAREGLAKAEEKERKAREQAANAGQNAGERAAAAAKKAAELRENASKAEEKAREAAERAEKMRSSGINTEKADLIAARAKEKAARMRAAAERVEATALKASEAATGAQAAAEQKAAKASEDSAKKRAGAKRVEEAAKKAAEKAESAQSKAAAVRKKAEDAAAKSAEKTAKETARKAKGLNATVSKLEARLSDEISTFNPAQERHELMLQRKLDQMKKKVRDGLGPEEDDSKKSFGGFDRISSGQKTAALAVVAAATAAATFAGRVAFDFAAATVNAQAFREDAIGAIRIIRRTQGDADEVMRMATSTADFIGQGRQETLGQFVNLLNQFDDRDFVDRIIRSVADLRAASPEANIDAIVRAMGKIKAQGNLQGDELNMLTEAGIPAEKVYARLADRLGKTVDEVKRLKSAAKIKSDVANSAILDVMKESAGNRAPGLAARLKSLQDMSGLMRRLDAAPANLLADMNVTPGMRAYKSFMAETIESLDPAGPRWKRISGVLGGIVNSVFGTAFRGRDPGALIDSIISKVETAAPLATAAISGFNTGFSTTMRIFQRMDELSGGGPFAEVQKLLGIDKVPWIETVARGIGLIAGGIGIVVAGIGIFGSAMASLMARVAAVPMLFWGAVSNIGQYIQQAVTGPVFYESGEALGDAIVDGLVSSINSGARAVAASVRALAAGTIGSARSAFGIASPSKPFIEIGRYLPKGTEVGIQASAAGAIRAAERFAFATTAAASDAVLGPQMPAFAPAGASGVSVGAAPSRQAARGEAGRKIEIHVESINVVVQGGKDPQEDGRAVGNAVWDTLRRLAEKG